MAQTAVPLRRAPAQWRRAGRIRRTPRIAPGLRVSRPDARRRPGAAGGVPFTAGPGRQAHDEGIRGGAASIRARPDPLWPGQRFSAQRQRQAATQPEIWLEWTMAIACRGRTMPPEWRL